MIRALLVEYTGVAPISTDKDLTLVGEEQARSVVVTMTSGEGRVNEFKVEHLTTGERRQSDTAPDGTVSSTLFATGGEETTTLADGTQIMRSEGPDPRFQMQAPVPASVTVNLPSGLAFNQTTKRDVELENPNDLLSLISLTETITTNGKTVVDDYDAATRTWTRTSDEGRKSYLVLDEKGRLIERRIEGLSGITKVEYDPRGQLQTLIQTDGVETRETTFDYHVELDHQKGYLEDITDAEDRVASFDYDAAGRVELQTLPDLRVIGFDHDPNGNLSELRPPGKPTHSFLYDDVDQEKDYIPPVAPGVALPATQYGYNRDRQLERVDRPDGKVIDPVYHPTKGQLTALNIDRGSYGYSYYPTSGQLEQITAPDGGTLTYTYDGALLKDTIWAGLVSGTINRTYNTDFLIEQRCINDALCVNFDYDGDLILTQAGELTLIPELQKGGLLSSTTLGLVTDSYGYNNFGELETYTAAVDATDTYAVTYRRDRLGRIETKIETVEGVTTTFGYEYDLAGRLWIVKENEVETARYTYDDNGNRTHINGALVGTYDDQDRLETYNGAIYAYTPNGELRTKTEGTATSTYDYDELGNLLKVTLPGDTIIEYLIDGQNRRIGKKVNNVLVQGFLYKNQLNPIAEFDGDGNIVNRFVYAEKDNVPAYMVTIDPVSGVETTYRIVSDHLGSPRLVVNTVDGSIAQRMDYDEWGNVTTDTKPGFQPFGFAGGIYDSHTELVRFGARDFDPPTGRWSVKDPIGFMGGDSNLYGYVLNNPVNLWDNEGLVPPVVVYVVAIGGRVAYVGITNYLKRRAKEHVKRFGKDALVKEVKQCKARASARKYEQGGIEKYGKDNLENLINSISKNNPKYKDYIKDAKKYQEPFR